MIKSLSPALVALMALPAAAQDGASGLSFGGDVKLEYLDASPHLWALDGDIALNWRSGGALGFDAALETTYLDDGSDFTNIWAALVLSTGAGEFAVGAPRPLVDTLGVMPRFSSSRVIDLEASFLLGPVSSTASRFDHGLTPGITWKQSSGNLTFGGGYHHLNDGSNIDIAEGVMRYQAGDTAFFVSGEFAETAGPNLTLLQIGAFYDADRFDLGAAFTQLNSSETDHSLRLYGSFDVMPALTVRGDALMIQDASDIYSLSATYTMESGLFVEGGGTDANSETIYDIGVGFKF